MQTKPVTNYELVETANLDEISEQLARLYRHISITPKWQQPLHTAKISYAQSASSSLSVGFLTYGVSTEVYTEEPIKFFSLQYPLTGNAEVACGTNRFQVRAGKAFIPGRKDPLLMRTSPDWAHYILRLDQDAVERQLVSMLGQPLKAPLEFENCLDLIDSRTASLKHLLQYIVQDIGGAYSPLSSEVTAKQVEQLLITALLSSQPHNYTELLESSVELVAPRYVNQAKEYMRAHLTEPMSVNRLVEVTGVSSRTLSKAFNRYCNSSPMAWFKHQKILAIRKDLLAAQPGQTVTDIACNWGIYNLGQFAAYYRDVFGELPSETLRR